MPEEIMGSITKKIRKKAEKYQKALEIVESSLDNIEMPESFETYDLADSVKSEIEKAKIDRRQARNRRKAVKRGRR